MEKWTVLYIEDNPANFSLVERILGREGFRVLGAQNGLEGIRRAMEERGRLDLVLMDINLPLLDGYETTARLRSIPGFEGIPILALTVNNFTGDRSRTLAAGCDGYIQKPIDLAGFADEVRSYLSGRRERLLPDEELKYLREQNRKLAERLEGSIETLERSKKSAEHAQKLASVGEMASGIMHELRSPLSAISFMAEYLMNAEESEEGRAKYLEKIVNNAARIQALSKGVSSFVRPADELKGECDVACAIEEVLALAEHELVEHNVEVELDVSRGLPPIWAAEGQFHHVFMNLVRNGAQAMTEARMEEAHGERRQSKLSIAACLEEGGGFVTVDVADNGPGVPDEIKRRVCEPFFTTKARGEGTGLGLHIACQVMEDLGGSLEILDAPGGGALFSLRFPAASGRATKEDRIIGNRI